MSKKIHEVEERKDLIGKVISYAEVALDWLYLEFEDGSTLEIKTTIKIDGEGV